VVTGLGAWLGGRVLCLYSRAHTKLAPQLCVFMHWQYNSILLTASSLLPVMMALVEQCGQLTRIKNSPQIVKLFSMPTGFIKNHAFQLLMI